MNLGKRMMNDLDRDIEEHIAMETQDNIERCMCPKRPATPPCESSAMWFERRKKPA